MRSIKKALSAIIFGLLFSAVSAQVHTDQNGIKTTIIGDISTQSTQAKRFEVLSIGYNSHHWQGGGIVMLELFSTSYATGYEKYIVEVGYFQGANFGSPRLRLVNSYGAIHNSRLLLGTYNDINTSLGGKSNRVLPVYMDVRDYSTYKVKISYLQNRVNEITDYNQIRISENPVAVDIADFNPNKMVDEDLLTSGLLRVSGAGNHYFQNGNVGIGTTQPDARLSVKGMIHAEEIKVDLNIPGPDYVFNYDYKLLSLAETEAYIKVNHHLPDFPSAIEMKNEGINVIEMQMKLLKKIEELTLHTIQQNQKINVLLKIIKQHKIK